MYCIYLNFKYIYFFIYIYYFYFILFIIRFILSLYDFNIFFLDLTIMTIIKIKNQI